MSVAPVSDAARMRTVSYKSKYFIELALLSDSYFSHNLEKIQIIAIGYPRAQVSDSFSFNARDGRKVFGYQVKDFFHNTNDKTVSIGNVTFVNNNEEGNHLAPTWQRSSGGPVVIVTDENVGIGVHTSGNPLRNYFVTTNDPYLAQFARKKIKTQQLGKDEL